VGLCSYLLIGFIPRKSASDEANKASSSIASATPDLFSGMFFIAGLRIDACSSDVEQFARACSQLLGIPIHCRHNVLSWEAALSQRSFRLYVWMPMRWRARPVSAMIHASPWSRKALYMVARSNAMSCWRRNRCWSLATFARSTLS